MSVLAQADTVGEYYPGNHNQGVSGLAQYDERTNNTLGSFRSDVVATLDYYIATTV